MILKMLDPVSSHSFRLLARLRSVDLVNYRYRFFCPGDQGRVCPGSEIDI
jgi:hypothetical protein